MTEMKESKKSILVLDANAFINCSKLNELGAKYRLITTADVMGELKDQKTRSYLQKMPFQIQQKDFDEKSLEFVKSFAKKTGDIGSLSDVDMQLIALAHTLYVREGLADKLRKQPPPLVEKVQYEQNDDTVEEQDEENKQISQSQSDQQQQEGWITVPSKDKKQQDSEESDIDEQQGWVTPNNYEKKMAQLNTAYLENKKPQKIEQPQQNQPQISEEQFQIQLISADFAIQNVATQMGIKLMSLDGRAISSIRRFIWECYLCWKQYKINENKVKMCSNCGYNSLSKIAYSMDTNGNVILHRKKGWKPNLKVQEWKEKKFQQDQKRKKHQHDRRRKKQSIFENV